MIREHSIPTVCPKDIVVAPDGLTDNREDRYGNWSIWPSELPRDVLDHLDRIVDAWDARSVGGSAAWDRESVLEAIVSMVARQELDPASDNIRYV
jgi:hypothetical protein